MLCRGLVHRSFRVGPKITAYNEGFDAFCTLAKLRTLRGYMLKTIACDNPLMLHFLTFVSDTQNIHELVVTKTGDIKPNLRSLPNQKSTSLLSNILPLPVPQQLGLTF